MSKYCKLFIWYVRCSRDTIKRIYGTHSRDRMQRPETVRNLDVTGKPNKDFLRCLAFVRAMAGCQANASTAKLKVIIK